MEYKKFNFEPEEGFLDSNFYEDTPDNPREILQRQHNQTRDYINSVVETLNSKTEGASGSESIKSPNIEGVAGENVFEQIKDIKRQINDAMDAVIPDASVGEEKIKNSAITADKIRDKQITTEKFDENAICPYANEPVNINGKKSSQYATVGESASPFMFKELVCGEEFADTYGKIYNGKRYFLKDNKIYTLNLTTGETAQYSETLMDTSVKFCVYDENNIYYATTKRNNNSIQFTLYKYEKEYNESILIVSLELYKATYENYYMLDMDICKDNLILLSESNADNWNWNHIYKIPVSELSNKDAYVQYFAFSNSYKNANILSCKDDFIAGNRIFKNGDKNDVVTLFSNIQSYDENGILLTTNAQLPIVDYETLLPKYAAATGNISNSFLYDGFLYAYIEKYLFRTRIF